MKKILLVLVALVATVTASADDSGWQKSFSPVALQKDLGGVHTAVAADGSVYASSTYNQAFTVGDVTVADPEGLTSSCILKFDKDGNAKWVVTLLGKCIVYAMTADADGTLYVAAQSQDEKVICTGTDGKHYEIENPASDIYGYSYSAFILRIDANGAIAATKTISTIANAELLTSGLYYPLKGDIYVKPLDLKIDGDNLYVSVNFTGDNNELGWYGSILNVFDFAYQDNPSSGIFSLSKELGALQSELVVQNSEVISYNQYYPEALDFTPQDGKLHILFIGFGSLKVSSRSNGRTENFATTDDESGNKEHALVWVTVKDGQLSAPTHFVADKHAKDAIPYKLVGSTIIGKYLYFGGNSYGNAPVYRELTKDYTGSFVASINIEKGGNTHWAVFNEAESQASCMVITGDEVHLSTDKANYAYVASTGALKETGDVIYVDMDVCNNQYFGGIYIEPEVTVENVVTTPAKVVVRGVSASASGISTTKAAVKAGAAKIYNMNGVELSAPQKGLNIIKTAEGTKKIVK